MKLMIVHEFSGNSCFLVLGDCSRAPASRQTEQASHGQQKRRPDREPEDSVDHRCVEATNDLLSSGVPAWTGDLGSVMTAFGESTDAGSGGASSSNAPPPPSSIVPTVTASASGRHTRV